MSIEKFFTYLKVQLNNEYFKKFLITVNANKIYHNIKYIIIKFYYNVETDFIILFSIQS